MKIRSLLAALCAALILLPGAAAETDGDCIYTMLDADGNRITMRAAQMFGGDV